MTTQPGQMGKQAMQQIEEAPTNFYFWAMVASIITSAWLFFTNRRWEAIFVGLWAPTFISFGLFNKLLRPSKEWQGSSSRQWPTGS